MNDSLILDWLNVGLRWVHLIAGIGWIGTSLYFMWLDAALIRNDPSRPDVEGHTWLLHSGGFYLVERNCPYYNTAMRRPILCNVSINALTRLLGVRVERDERFQNGDGRCVFHVHADQPIDASAWEFHIEE